MTDDPDDPYPGIEVDDDAMAAACVAYAKEYFGDQCTEAWQCPDCEALEMAIKAYISERKKKGERHG